MSFLIACAVWAAVLVFAAASALKILDRIYPKKMAYRNSDHTWKNRISYWLHG